MLDHLTSEASGRKGVDTTEGLDRVERLHEWFAEAEGLGFNRRHRLPSSSWDYLLTMRCGAYTYVPLMPRVMSTE